MPRPSMKDQRSGEILDAYLTCVARFGLEGATQDRIAAQAGVKRPLLRHYLGNRDQMIAALSAYVVDGFNDATAALNDALGEMNTPAELIEALFDDPTSSDPRLMLAWQALIAAAVDYPDMRAPLLDSLERFLNVLTTALRRMLPGADTATLRAVAQGISAAYVNLDALSPLKPPADWRTELRQAALLLVQGLEASQ